MCQFCIEHGEGKKWYLAMKNYSDELLHQEFSAAQKEIFDAPTRADAITALPRHAPPEAANIWLKPAPKT